MGATRIRALLQHNAFTAVETRSHARAFELAANVTVWNSPAGGALSGGDWCDVLTISDEAVALTVGDVAGHGEGVAQAMESIRASVLHAIQHLHVPSAVLAVANGVAEYRCDGLIVTAIVAYYNHLRGTLTFANAGHPPPLVMTPEGHAFLTQRRADLPLGIFSHHDATDYVVALSSDSLVVLYTDGITERDHDPIRGELELADAARLAFQRPEVNVARAIGEYVFRNGPGSDDAAAMALRTNPSRA